MASWSVAGAGLRGLLHEPEWFEPYDVTRLTRRIAFGGAIRSRRLDATLAWGRNIHYNGYNDRRRLYPRMGPARDADDVAGTGVRNSSRSSCFGPDSTEGLIIRTSIRRSTPSRSAFARRGHEPRGRFGVGATRRFIARQMISSSIWSARSYHVFLDGGPNGHFDGSCSLETRLPRSVSIVALSELLGAAVRDVSGAVA